MKLKPGPAKYPLQHGRRNVAVWMKPEHIAEMDQLAMAEKLDRTQFFLRLITYGLKTVGQRSLAKRIYADVVDRHPGASKEIVDSASKSI